MSCDVGRTYFYVFAVRPVYVHIVDEHSEFDDRNTWGRLNVPMHCAKNKK